MKITFFFFLVHEMILTDKFHSLEFQKFVLNRIRNIEDKGCLFYNFIYLLIFVIVLFLKDDYAIFLIKKKYCRGTKSPLVHFSMRTLVCTSSLQLSCILLVLCILSPPFQKRTIPQHIICRARCIFATVILKFYFQIQYIIFIKLQKILKEKECQV